MDKFLKWFKYDFLVLYKKYPTRMPLSTLIFLLGIGQASDGSWVILFLIPLLYIPEIWRKAKDFIKYYKTI